jgi:hypothetical protein
MKITGFDGMRTAFALALLFAIGPAAAPTSAAPAIAAPQESQASETRFALVIGNGAYPNVPLKNPVNDARDLAAALKKLGFSVSLVTDGDMSAMSRAIRDFGNAIKRPDAVALFYYSGHGVQYHGANYLIPAKSDIQDPDELGFSAVNAEQVYAKMESSGDRTNIVMLDACRNNPFPGAERASERGLAVVGNIQPPQSLIVYATAPGKTAQDGEGKNGVFTTALLRHLADPSLDVELMIRRVREDVVAATGGAQVPWQNSSLSGSGFSFAGGGKLLVSTDPSGAEIYVDGQRRGVSPLSLVDLPRYFEFEIGAKIGAKSAARRMTLTDSAEATLQLSLQIARGSIIVAANEKGVKALIDGSGIAIGPNGAIEGVEVGLHTLELQGDSSGFKSQVQVIAGKASKVDAILVPVGSLTLTLPNDTSCRIEGMGISDTTSRYAYGQLPAGSYRLDVSGGDYEKYSETVKIERGKRTDFAPALHFTNDYLSAKYGVELARLQQIAKEGVASHADVEDAGVLAKKIKAEGRPALADLAAKADALGAALASLRPAAAQNGAQSVTNAGKNTGTLTLTSDPPGMNIAIDGGDPVMTPASVELAPGAHSFEPLPSYLNWSTYYLGQPLQWITISAGVDLNVPIRIKPASAKLIIKSAPAGYTVYVNEEKTGVTPFRKPIDVYAGLLRVRFEREGKRTTTINATVQPDQVTTITWGVSK